MGTCRRRRGRRDSWPAVVAEAGTGRAGPEPMDRYHRARDRPGSWPEWTGPEDMRPRGEAEAGTGQEEEEPQGRWPEEEEEPGTARTEAERRDRPGTGPAVVAERDMRHRRERPEGMKPVGAVVPDSHRAGAVQTGTNQREAAVEDSCHTTAEWRGTSQPEAAALDNRQVREGPKGSSDTAGSVAGSEPEEAAEAGMRPEAVARPGMFLRRTRTEEEEEPGR